MSIMIYKRKVYGVGSPSDSIRSVNGKTADIANNVTIDGGEIVLDTSVPQSPTVRDALAEETTARETGDATLHNSVDLLNEAIGDETENREAGDEILQENIDTVQSNVGAVQSNLNAEIGDREEGRNYPDIGQRLRRQSNSEH